MLSTLTMIALSFAAPSLLPRVVEPSTGLEEILQLVAAENVTTPPVAVQPLPTPEEPKEKRLICKGCNTHEQKTVSFLQEKGITDKNAIATILGNIQQESTFVPNICEGGARTSYYGCSRGGFGLIQFTSIDRYNGLGNHARKLGLPPESLEAQLEWIVAEPQWKSIENQMKRPGKSIETYMNHAYTWIGWGHHGARTSYAYDYARKLVLS
jgi:hypothetical protein